MQLRNQAIISRQNLNTLLEKIRLQEIKCAVSPDLKLDDSNIYKLGGSELAFTKLIFRGKIDMISGG
jgi:hypothetical protein